MVLSSYVFITFEERWRFVLPTILLFAVAFRGLYFLQGRVHSTHTHSTKNQKLYQSQRHIIIILCCCSRVREWKLHPFYEIILYMPLSFAVFGLPACVRAQCSCGPLFKFSVPFSQRIWHMNCVHNSRRLPEWRQTKIVKLRWRIYVGSRARLFYLHRRHTHIYSTNSSRSDEILFLLLLFLERRRLLLLLSLQLTL